jgi:hypothetical protein
MHGYLQAVRELRKNKRKQLARLFKSQTPLRALAESLGMASVATPVSGVAVCCLCQRMLSVVLPPFLRLLAVLLLTDRAALLLPASVQTTSSRASTTRSRSCRRKWRTGASSQFLVLARVG